MVAFSSSVAQYRSSELSSFDNHIVPKLRAFNKLRTKTTMNFDFAFCITQTVEYVVEDLQIARRYLWSVLDK